MTNIDRERVAAQVRKAVTLRDEWQKERQAVLAEQLAANAETKRRWMESDPIEVIQSQFVYNANAQALRQAPGYSGTVRYSQSNVPSANSVLKG